MPSHDPADREEGNQTPETGQRIANTPAGQTLAGSASRARVGQPPRISEIQYHALRYCLTNSAPDVNGEVPWLDLAGLGLGRATIRALQRLGLVEAMEEGFPGQLVGQRYRITEAGRAAIENGGNGA